MRNQKYIEVNINLTISVFACAEAIDLFPSFLKPIIKSSFMPRWRAIAKMKKSLRQIIRDRLHAGNVHSQDCPGKESQRLYGGGGT
ncbi:hypothetical protein DFS33DRAFT_5757 [Desarmillaria ectypa]|nr:hypothetical protein DFS33DRAFT_5757 [Desarmillaria ectypa]